MERKNILFPAGMNPVRIETLGDWLDSEDITYSRRVSDGSWTIITELSPDQSDFLEIMVTRIVRGSIVRLVTVETASVNGPSLPVTDAELTWLQFATRLRGLTGHTMRRGVHDEVVSFAEMGSRFTYMIHRVEFNEGRTRDRVTKSYMEIALLQKVGVKWEVTSRTIEDEVLAPDISNTGRIMTPEQRWANAQHQAKYLAPKLEAYAGIDARLLELAYSIVQED